VKCNSIQTLTIPIHTQNKSKETNSKHKNKNKNKKKVHETENIRSSLCRLSAGFLY
jgi:hypothetical protein